MKVFEYDARKGSNLISNGQRIAYDTNYYSFSKTDKGVALTTKSAKENIQSITLPNNIIPYFDYSKPFSFTMVFYNTNMYVFFNFGPLVNVPIGFFGNAFLIIYGTTSGTIRRNFTALSKNKFYCLTVNYDGSKKASGLTAFLNGGILFLTTAIDNLVNNTSIIPKYSLFGDMTGTNLRALKLLNFRWDDQMLSLKQHQDIYANFLTSIPRNTPIYLPQTVVQQPSELSDSGLIAAYAFPKCISNGKAINIAVDSPANGGNARQYDGTISKGYNILANGLQSSSKVQSTITLGTTARMYLSEFTIVGFINFKLVNSFGWIFSTTQDAGGLASGFGVRTTAGGLLQFWASNAPIQTVSTSFTASNTLISFSFRYKSGIGGSIFINGINILSTPNYGVPSFPNISPFIGGAYNGNIQDLRIYNRAITDKEAKAYHNQFASKVVLKESFDYPVGATRFGNWVVKSGSFIISEDSKGKYLKCVTNGVIQLFVPNASTLATKTYTGNMTLTKVGSLVKLTATSNQISRLIILTQGLTV